MPEAAEDDGSGSDGRAIAGSAMDTLGPAAGGYSILNGNRKAASNWCPARRLSLTAREQGGTG